MKSKYPWSVVLILALLIIAAYWPVRSFDFIDFDDKLYVTDNTRVQAGLSAGNLKWAFTALQPVYWQPVTWISHMMDVEMYGLKPGGHHLTNFLIHLASTILLFTVLRRATGSTLRSAMAAALFSLHPLAVESVAWVPERKNVLGAFFWLLTIQAYLVYVRNPGAARYSLVLAAFILGLMSKPVLVTLPLILLLLDVWPLGRVSRTDGHPVRACVLEKIPLVLLSIAVSAVTYQSQMQAGAIVSLDRLPMDIRISNALLSYVKYLGMMVWPSGLAVMYPYPETAPPLYQTLCAGAALIGITILAIRSRRAYLTVGWFWYLVTLIPMIGLVQAGPQAMADRHTYVPIIGIAILVSWGAGDVVERWKWPAWLPACTAVSLVLICALLTRFQLRHWRDSAAVYEHAIQVTDRNTLAHNNLGTVYLKDGRIGAAVTQFLQAIRIRPDYVSAHYNLALTRLFLGEIDEATRHFEAVVRIDPNHADAHYNLGVILAQLGQLKKSETHISEALRIRPQDADAHHVMGLLLSRQGHFADAAWRYSDAISIKADFAEAHYNLGLTLARQGKPAEARDHFEEAIRIRPGDSRSHNNLGAALAQIGRTDDALAHFRKALEADPRNVEALCNTGILLSARGRVGDAAAYFEKALLIDPTYARARRLLEKIR